MMKRGFTLIELMVVIVIIGILSAVAIPKLFGMTAKAKASEVGPAAGTWSKLQQAYVQETGSLGTWTEIGYKAPGNTGASGSVSTNLTYDDNSSTAGSWGAFNHVAMGDCTAETSFNTSKAWTAGMDVNGSINAVVNPKTACAALTPNFKNLQ